MGDPVTAAGLAPLDGVVGYRLRRLSGLMIAGWGRWMAARGIDVTPVQGGILMLIGGNAGITQVELARLLGIEGPTLLQALGPLRAAGFVTRARSTRDGRAFCLGLTGAGERMAARIEREIPALEANSLAGLDAAERQTLLALVRKAIGAAG